jgi:hypothetical protein
VNTKKTAVDAEKKHLPKRNLKWTNLFLLLLLNLNASLLPGLLSQSTSTKPNLMYYPGYPL